MVWGIVDQLVATNVRRHHEGAGGFDYPGVLTILVDGVGALSVYHRDVFLGGIGADALILRHSDALHSESLKDRVTPHLSPIAKAIAGVLREQTKARSKYLTRTSNHGRTPSRACASVFDA